MSEEMANFANTALPVLTTLIAETVIPVGVVIVGGTIELIVSVPKTAMQLNSLNLISPGAIGLMNEAYWFGGLQVIGGISYSL